MGWGGGRSGGVKGGLQQLGRDGCTKPGVLQIQPNRTSSNCSKVQQGGCVGVWGGGAARAADFNVNTVT